MGWSGYGLYDGDGTATTQMSMLEAAGIKKNLLMKDGSILEDPTDWYVGKTLVHQNVVKQVFDSWDKVTKNVISKIKKNTFDEDSALDHTMAADFFLKHKAEMPAGLQEKAIEATKFLIHGGHSDDFDSPASRKRVLRNFLEKLESFEPTVTFTYSNSIRSVDKIISDSKARNYGGINKDFEAAVKWLFDENNKSSVLNNFVEKSFDTLTDSTWKTLKEKISNANVFDYPDYMNIPKKISGKLSGDAVDILQEIVQTDLIDLYKKDLQKLGIAYTKVQKLENEYKDSVQEFENLGGNIKKLKM